MQRNGWVSDGVCGAQINVWIAVAFHLTLTKFGINIVEWPLLNANVSFRFQICLCIIELRR